MPAKKKTETAVEAVKAETVAEVKKTAQEAPAAKAAAKTAEKPAAKKTAEKKTPAKAKTPAAPKQTVKVQFGGDEYDLAEIEKAVAADCKSKVKGRIKTVEIYVKPEDKAVYYVVNSDFSDKITL